MLRLLCVLAVISHAMADTVLLNQLVDQLLIVPKTDTNQTGMDVIPIPEMNHDWKYRWHFVKLSGHMNCRDGYAKLLGSLRRTGDVTMTTQGNQIIFKVALELGTVKTGFKNCMLKAIYLFSLTRHITATMSSNSIEAQATLIKNGNQCTARLDSISLVNLGKIKVNTGSGVLHKIENRMINWFIKHIHGKVVESVNAELQKQAFATFPKTDLCNKIPQLY